MSEQQPLLSLRGAHFAYPGHPVLTHVDFTLYPGERVAIAGANGAGKSSLLHLLVGLNSLSQGTLTAFGRPIQHDNDFRAVRAQTGLLFQDPDDQLFCPTVLEDVAFGPLNLGKTAVQARAIAEKVLDQLGLSGFAQRITHKLSGGEKRLVALATVLAMEPRVLLLDEPTNALDKPTERRMTELLLGLPQAMVFISHDPHFVDKLATRAVLLQNGSLQDATLHRHPHLHSHLHIHGADITDHSHQDPIDS